MMQAWTGSVAKAATVLGLGFAMCGYAGSAQERAVCSTAAQSDIVLGTIKPGVTPFIASVPLSGTCVPDVVAVTFTIAPKPKSVSAPVHATWWAGALSERGYVSGNTINLPVFGLYDGYQNQVRFRLRFPDGTVQLLESPITTATYTGTPGTVLKNPTILQARSATSTVGFNYMLLKGQYGSPVIIDTDGELRWIVPHSTALSNLPVYFTNGQFLVGSGTSQALVNVQLDGTQSTVPLSLPRPLIQEWTHNIDPGPHQRDFLGEFSGLDSLGASQLDVVADITLFETPPVWQTYDVAEILTSYMKANGDDPTQFVRPGVDWFHINTTTYDPSDDTIIISGREDFIMKVQRKTKQIVWIFGSPAGYWHTFPSLAAKALTLDAGGDYPIGQHGLSITSDGYIMLFNDGEGSLNQPSDNGISRTYSEVNAYSVNATAMTAHQEWSFDANQSIFTNFCGSIYEAGNSYLIDFANEGSNSNASMRLIGLDSTHSPVFDFRFGQAGTCVTAWNAIPVKWEALEIVP